MSRNSQTKRNSSNRASTGSEIARSTLKVFLSNGDSRSVKCGEATDVKVGFYFSSNLRFCKTMASSYLLFCFLCLFMPKFDL